MASLTIIATMIVVYGPLIGLLIAAESGGREIRPSEHGLEYQNSPPPGNKFPPKMKSFFKGKDSSSTSSNVALPKAMNSTSQSSWWGNGGDGDGGGGKGNNGGGRDHVKDVLLVGSIVCGITGVIILVASGFLYIFRFRNQKSSSSGAINNKLQLVVHNA
ncbi:Transmembrane protein [Quillaja saponaria]|uniref:Transmembrane protein n=1 Tax=Quillaja saponaria TaxID=32244 RepID=A0AAD7M4Z2_QUISA|nr:Transmembrane protein [Quillaja saponaria]